MSVTIEQTPFGRPELISRWGNAVLKGPTHKMERFGFWGDLGLKYAPKLADEARPPELCAEQVYATAVAGAKSFEFFAAYLHSFEYMELFTQILGDTLSSEGKYFLYCNNLDLSKRYQIRHGPATFWVMPIDEASVYNELLAIFYLEKTELKKLDTAGKVDRLADKALRFNDKWPEISYVQGLKLMGPVADRGANRPV